MTISTRRGLIIGAGAAALAGVSVAHAQDTKLPTTPGADLGPYYPVVKPGDQDRDLTRVKGRKGRAKGQIILLTGRVLKPDGSPIANAAIEIWQCDANGRYAHPSEDTQFTPGEVDPFFQHFAKQKTDADGRYSFLTIASPAYPGGNGPNGPFLRAPHIHFDVASKVQRRVTQMYLPGTDPKVLKDDFVLHGDLYAHAIKDFDLEKEMAPVLGRISDTGPGLESGAKLCTWDIVLNG
jgi:protocatechuate 3,4-dioxygenase, beta subunit